MLNQKHWINKKEVVITIAQKPQSKQQKLDLARAQSDVPQLSVIGKVSKRKLFLDGLNPNIEDKDLLYFMSKYGPVIEAIVQTSTSSPNICAYVIMADEKDATNILSQDSILIMSKPVKVRYAIEKVKGPGGPSSENDDLSSGTIEAWGSQSGQSATTRHDVPDGEGVTNAEAIKDLLAEFTGRHPSSLLDTRTLQTFTKLILEEDEKIVRELKTQISELNGKVSQLEKEIKVQGEREEDRRSESVW